MADACDLLTEDELADVAGGDVGAAKPTVVAGLAVCQWPRPDGVFVQAASVSASDWAQRLPELLRMLEMSPFGDDPDYMRKVKEMGRLVESKETLTPTEACVAFSKMLELQGQPPGTSSFVNVSPNEEEALAVSGQMCSTGRFTTVTLASEDGLAKPLPGEDVLLALQRAHRHALG